MYLQIMEQVKQRVAVREWTAGDEIPSIRQLAMDLRVIVTQQGKGLFIRSLILKDWYFQRRAILLCLVAGVLSLGIIAFGGKLGFYLGLLLLITIMILIGATLVMGTLVGERENQTLAFVMSLPISFREYTAAKMLVNLLVFIPFWLTESKGWTISAMIAGNLAINVVGYIVAHIPGISDGMFGNTIHWRPAATISL